jgi:hypothetical protein
MSSTSTSVTEELSPRLRIREVIEFGKKLVALPELLPGPVQMHTRRAKHQLKRIFGDVAEHAALFDDPPKPLSDEAARRFVAQRNQLLEEIARRLDASVGPIGPAQERIFFGHGASPLWRELKDFVADRLSLPWDEFNRTSVAGYTTVERLQDMLNNAAFAFLIMTAEEEHADARLHARSNVIHEVGLFQGRLGIRKAIVLLEEGCSEFSNIVGLSQIRFPRGRISAVFEDVRGVLEREGLATSRLG